MKNFILFYFILFCYTINAQRPFVPVEITKSDGTTMNVLLRDIYFPDTNSYAGIIKQSKNKSLFEKTQKFEYKTSENSSIEKIGYDEVKKIKILDNNNKNILGFEKLNIKNIDKKGVITDKSYDAIVPILFEGKKANVYGYDYLICKNSISSDCRYFMTVIYIKNNNSDYAVMPMDIDQISAFQMGNLKEKIIYSFKYIGSDCPGFIEYLDDLDIKIHDRKLKKEVLQEFEDYHENNKGNGRGAISNYTTHVYMYILKEYEKRCP